MDGYWKREFSRDALRLEHSSPRDLYVSRWQQGTSPLPLLLLRGALCSGVLAIWIASFVSFEVHKAMWFIYLTHWGLTLLLVTTLAATALSAKAFFWKLPDASLGLSWYERTYWVLYNTCAPVAFLITVFYWTVLYSHPDESMEDYDPQLFLDVSIHGLNSAAILLELLASAAPSRLLHVYQPLAFALAYMIFGLIYHFAGGVNRSGEPWVYSVINWAAPGLTLAVAAGTGALLALLHALVVGAARARDALAARLVTQHAPHSFHAPHASHAPAAGAGSDYSWSQRDTAVGVA